MSVTLRELRALGLSWPRGPEEPPADEDAPIDLDRVASILDYEYGESRGTPAFLEQKEAIEELAAAVAAKHADLAVLRSAPTPPTPEQTKYVRSDGRRMRVVGGEGDGLLAAASSGRLASIEELELVDLSNAERVLVAVAESPMTSALTSLVLASDSLGEDAFTRLVQSPLAVRLRSLRVRTACSTLGRPFTTTPLPALRSFALTGTGSGITFFSFSFPMGAPNLDTIELDRVWISVDDVVALSRRPMTALGTVHVAGRELDVDVVEALARAPWIARLQSVSLPATSPTAPLARLLSRLGPSLRSLGLGGDRFQDLPSLAAALRPHAGLEELRLGRHADACAIEPILGALPRLRRVAFFGGAPTQAAVAPMLQRQGFVADPAEPGVFARKQ